MKKIILTLWVIILTQFTLTNANNDLFSSCSEKEISQTEILKNNSEKQINDYISKNNLWEILNSTTRRVINWEYKTNELIFSDNWDYIFATKKWNWELSIYNIVKNGNILKTFSADENSNIEWLNSQPTVFISKDGKHYAYSYNENKKYCINIDWKDTCYESWNQKYYYFYPMNISFSDDWSKVMYSIITWEQWDDWIHYIDEIYINYKKVPNWWLLVSNGWNYDWESYYTTHWQIKDLFFSPNWENYAFTKSALNNDKMKFGIYKNWELLTNELAYLEYDLFFWLNSSDFYYYGFTNNDENKKLFFKNWEKINNLPYIMNFWKWLWFIVKDLNNTENKWNSYFIYNDKEYQSDYNIVANLKNDWKNVNFVWWKTNQKLYNVSCVLKNSLETKIKEESKEKTSTVTNKETEVKSVDEKYNTTTYKLSSKEKEAIKIVANKISKSWVLKKNKYVIQLNQLLNKLEKWSRKYEIINWVLYELDSIWLENFGNMLNN